MVGRSPIREIESIAVVTYKVARQACVASASHLRCILVAEEPDNLVLELLRALRADIGKVNADGETLKTEVALLRADMASVKFDINTVKGDLTSLRVDVASDLLKMQKETREQIFGVRRAVVEYHSAVVGHGMLISDLDERVRRIEQHLDLP